MVLMAMAPPVETTTVHASSLRPCLSMASAVMRAAVPIAAWEPSWVTACSARVMAGSSMRCTASINMSSYCCAFPPTTCSACFLKNQNATAARATPPVVPMAPGRKRCRRLGLPELAVGGWPLAEEERGVFTARSLPAEQIWLPFRTQVTMRVPLQHEHRGVRGRLFLRCEEQREERGLEEHAVGLVAGEVLRRADEGEEADAGHGDGRARKEVDDDGYGRGDAEPDDDVEHGVAGGDPQQRRREPVRLPAGDLLERGEVLARGKDAVRADEAVDLEEERVEGGEEDQAEGAEPEPSRAHVRRAGSEPLHGVRASRPRQ